MEFKYKQAYQKLETECPPKEYQGRIVEAYRWVFDNIEEPRNFTPQYFKNPKRFLPLSNDKKCTAMSLSLWSSKEAAKEAFNFLKDKFAGNKAYKVLGTKIAKGNLTEEDGVNSKIREDGHFSHHQSESTNYPTIFSIVENL